MNVKTTHTLIRQQKPVMIVLIQKTVYNVRMEENLIALNVRAQTCFLKTENVLIVPMGKTERMKFVKI